MRGGSGVRMAPTRSLFLLWAFLWIFFEPFGNLLLIQGKLLRIYNLLFRLKYFTKTLIFALPPPTLGPVAQTTHAWKFCSTQKNFEVRRSSPKVMYIISASPNLFERRDAHIQAYAAVSEQQNCSNSMGKLAGSSKLDRWIALDPLYTLNFIFGPL